MRGGGTNKDGKWLTKARLLKADDEIQVSGYVLKVVSTEKLTRGIIRINVRDSAIGFISVPAESEVELVSRPVVEPKKTEPKKKKGQLKLI